MEPNSDRKTPAGEGGGKNIILFADGTGNRGGYTPDSNVYRLYNSIDIHHPDQPQLIYYDNGVGTSKNKYVRALGGAFGIGFTRNVLDLYLSLARVYEPGDYVYLFGFSRGGATVRALNGFLAHSGLVDGRDLDEDELRDAADEALRVYRERGRDEPSLPKPHESGNGVANHGAIDVQVLGVWDTVSALGFPQRWKIKGLLMFVLNFLFKLLDRATELFFPHRFWDYELNPRVKHAFQALALDDERQTFHPMVWDETRSPETEVEQMWFAGAHSNVGGGYGRDGLANVALRWMMVRARNAGGRELIYCKGTLEEIRDDENEHGRLYNSRDGLSVYYRYAPREVARLCSGLLRDAPEVHSSVFSRMKYRTGNYATGHLPRDLTIGDTEGGTSASCTVCQDESRWEKLRASVRRPETVRKWLYAIFLELSLVVVGFALWLWKHPPGTEPPPVTCEGFVDCAGSARWWLDHLAALFDWITPAIFEGLVTLSVRLHPEILLGVVILLLLLHFVRRSAWARGQAAREEMRRVVMEHVAERKRTEAATTTTTKG